MAKISHIIAHEALDSRGLPTVSVTVTAGTARASAMVPSGKSTGSYEAHELRDGDARRYHGKGVLNAVRHVNTVIAKKLIGLDVAQQAKLDQVMITLDGTPNKKKLGANAILGVSLACARTAAQTRGQELYAYINDVAGRKKSPFVLPFPMMNILNGGEHADWANDVQEFMIVPQQSRFAERVRCGSEIFHTLGRLLHQKNLNTNKGDEGGYAPALRTAQRAFDMLMLAIATSGYKPGRDVQLAIDCAASEWWRSSTKRYFLPNLKRKLTTAQLIIMEKQWVKQYPLCSIEDGLAENDWAGWTALTKALPKTMIVGDDLYVTNHVRLQQGITTKAGNAILVKPNQIGTLSETLQTIALAHKHKFQVIISHRSGETTDAFIADLAVGAGAQYIKTGSVANGERVAKYNRLLEIATQIKT